MTETTIIERWDIALAQSAHERLNVTIELRQKHDGAQWQTTTHEQCPNDYLELSVTHDVIDTRKRGANRLVAGGAGVPDLSTLEDDGRWIHVECAERLRAIAERWHLNQLRAACAHQTIEYENDRYGRRVPSIDKTKPCSETGYRYGSAWLVELLPDDVLSELRSIVRQHPTPSSKAVSK